MTDASMTGASRVLSSRWLVPIEGDPIEQGWIRMDGDVIVEIGSGPLPTGAEDWGDVAILPGLVNAHTHLEFSSLDQPIGTPGIGLEDWISKVMASRGDTTAEQQRLAIEKGMQEGARSGVRLLGDIATPPIDYPVSADLPQRISFAEVVGLSSERSQERFAAAMTHRDTCEQAAISPHAPYSTHPTMIAACIRWSAKSKRPLAMHVAESPCERELLINGTGPMADALRRFGVLKEGLFPQGEAPFLPLIHQLAGCSRALLIHGNDLRQDEIEALAQHAHLSVVFCPRTHHFFDFPRHPVASLLAAGVRVALGTDSRASNPDLNLWNEVRYLLNHRPDLHPKDVLAMATVNGASALGRSDLGTLAVGTQPGLIAVPSTATTLDQLYQDLAEGEVSAGS